MLIEDTTSIYAGETSIKKVYLGDEVVYQKEEPIPYTPLEYLESNGNQRINTGYSYTSNNATIKTKFIHYNDKNTSKAVFGAYNNDNGYMTVATLYNGYYFVSNKTPINSLRYTFNTEHELEIYVEGNSSKTGSYSIYENKSIIASGTGVGEITPYSLYLFTQNNAGSPETPGTHSRIYYLQMYDNLVLVRDFIPVLDTNNVPCMYDKVTKTFFYNIGTGTFLYG